MSGNPTGRPFFRKGGTELRGRKATDAKNHPSQKLQQRMRTVSDQPDKTGARHPDLEPAKQGITQDEANEKGDLSRPEAKRAAYDLAQAQPGDTRELGENRIGETDPPEAAEHGGAEASPEASGQKSGGGSGGSEEANAKMAQATSRASRQEKPKG
jgi:hypothetical protein